MINFIYLYLLQLLTYKLKSLRLRYDTNVEKKVREMRDKVPKAIMKARRIETTDDISTEENLKKRENDLEKREDDVKKREDDLKKRENDLKKSEVEFKKRDELEKTREEEP